MDAMTNRQLKEVAYEMGRDHVLLPDAGGDAIILAVVELVHGSWPSEDFALDRYISDEIVREYERGWHNVGIEVGSKLENGATVVAYKIILGTNPHRILLCFWHKGTKVEYITWALNEGEEEPYWGHYFEKLEAAVEDYQGRKR